METFYNSILEFFQGMGYLGIFIMMAIESSFVPFPSEIAMIPAGASSHAGKMSFSLALLAGTAGAWFGASINYFLGKFLGSPIIVTLIEKYGKYIFLKKSHYDYAEEYFQKNGAKATLIEVLLLL